MKSCIHTRLKILKCIKHGLYQDLALSELVNHLAETGCMPLSRGFVWTVVCVTSQCRLHCMSQVGSGDDFLLLLVNVLVTCLHYHNHNIEMVKYSMP